MKPATMMPGLLLVFTPLQAMHSGAAGLCQLPEGVGIHVCGEYARWKRPGSVDYLDFDDVTTSGSAQPADYARLGFVHIKPEAPHGID